MSLIRKHGAVLQAWACLDLVMTVCHSRNRPIKMQVFNDGLVNLAMCIPKTKIVNKCFVLFHM